ncbi:hypothetical protein GCM10008096_27750 [Zhihengliuella salsuginis]|uniref:MFS transporter n=2 Tax=Zhihengliuella salsuginis TaxID=578222 RepID=A0ABQ3GNG8_9MICC|nr:hypothetical protein GCM10008096_27750 [Zhihengliuella salsuginis]
MGIAAVFVGGAYLMAGGGLGLWFYLLVGLWSLFAWARSPAMQASIIAVDPKRAMLSAALGISGFYGGVGIGAAVGGPLLDNLGAAALPLAGFVFVAGAWIFAARHERVIDLSVSSSASSL